MTNEEIERIIMEEPTFHGAMYRMAPHSNPMGQVLWVLMVAGLSVAAWAIIIIPIILLTN